MNEALVLYLYIASAILFILSLRGMSEVKTSRWGNWAGAAGMLIAVIATLLAFHIQRYDLMLGAIIIGGIVGVPIALKLPMTAVPQRTAMSHAFGSLAVALVGTAEYYQRMPNIDTFTMAVLAAEMILGYLTFTGSCIAFAKLQEMISGKPFVYPGRNFVSLGVFGITALLAVALILNPSQGFFLPIMAVFALLFGFLLVMGIGGADMPTVIAILNSYAGLSAAALGFVLDNKLLIVAGTLDGSSGLILAVLMCKAMNRSFANVLFGGFGQVQQKVVGGEEKVYKAETPEGAAQILDQANLVVIIPGYGMAVARAQHKVRELYDHLKKRGINVKFAIHPVAGRMPGHMNVLLAEAEIPYEDLIGMEDINPDMPQADVALVIGANDVVNPAARTDKGSPIYGMPIIDADRARTVFAIKRSKNPGFAGIDNELYFAPQTWMLFGDAKAVVGELVKQLSGDGAGH